MRTSSRFRLGILRNESHEVLCGSYHIGFVDTCLFVFGQGVEIIQDVESLLKHVQATIPCCMAECVTQVAYEPSPAPTDGTPRVVAPHEPPRTGAVVVDTGREPYGSYSLVNGPSALLCVHRGIHRLVVEGRLCCVSRNAAVGAIRGGR